MDKPPHVKPTYRTIWIIAKKNGQIRRLEARRPSGGELFWVVPKDPVIFFPVRGRPNRVLTGGSPELLPHAMFC